MSSSSSRGKDAGKAVAPSSDPATSTAEAAAFLQNLRALSVSIGEQISPILEKEQGVDLRLCFILHNIAEGALYPSAIAQTTGLPNSLISKHIDQLVKKGLIARNLDSQDTRRIRLTLTAKGKRAQRDTADIFTTLAHERLARIPAKRRIAFLAVLADLAREIE